jgi:hypothetical protein
MIKYNFRCFIYNLFEQLYRCKFQLDFNLVKFSVRINLVLNVVKVGNNVPV